MARNLAWTGLLVLMTLAVQAQTNAPKADDWLGQPASYPRVMTSALPDVRSNQFTALKAEFIAGRLKVTWPGQVSARATVHLVSSEEVPGHWPARDWRSEPMSRNNGEFERVLRVEDLDAPQIYFIKVVEGAKEWVSPMRLFHPRQAGMEIPTRTFWSFLEGFEEGTESWRLLSRNNSGSVLRTSPASRTGMASLHVVLGPEQQSVTVGTTRLRGRQLVRQGATGIRLWLRSTSGVGRARFTLHANAFTPEQAVAVAAREVSLNHSWQRVDISFSQFPPLPLAMVDFLSVELVGDGAREFLLDDLQLLGPWAAED